MIAAALAAAALSLSSPSFHDGARIPARYTCDGQDVSPSLRWSRVPAGARTLALELDDPDAPGGVFVHWLLWNLPARRRSLPARVAWRLQGRNSFGRTGYGGPCPPSGPAHHYVFTLYAVDRKLALARGATSTLLRNALSGHVVGRARLVGIYGR